MSKNKRKKKSDSAKHTNSGLGHVDVVPAEEFMGVGPNGENPEWQPGESRGGKAEKHVNSDKNETESPPH